MPILLDPARAPTLARLLQETDTTGLDWRLDPAGAGERAIAGIAALEHAGAQELAFIANPRYQDQLAGAQAGAVIVTDAVARAHREAGGNAVLVVCADPYLMYARVGLWFERQRRDTPPGQVHPSAVIAADAVLDPTASVGPLAVIEPGARIGAGAVIGAGCMIGRGCQIGPDSLLHPRVTLYAGVRVGARAVIHSGAVLGADGFGFAPDSTRAKGAWTRIPQFGGVCIGDDVDIGANTTIDRGALDDTVIGNGVKLDNQIMIAHNCQVGDHTAMAACVGIAGSTTIGSRCMIAGAAMIGGHLRIGDDVFVSGATAVFSNLEKPGRYTGIFPGTEHREWERNAVAVRHLADLARRVKALEKKG
ncbi:UDP-3-O-(3-hydroxymyristoyl)glucosamine N-acyltransferase [Pigmentiphaga soli]|uniref:UDP-3-O-acylglucosamine N-acyltransferase n=1 Tax=Pigmentiphaga soli TaxID=1007095 RepID=A0ABP8HEI7_9BURK